MKARFKSGPVPVGTAKPPATAAATAAKPPAGPAKQAQAATGAAKG
jgi:hypothetical protein